ncbi:MAG TPA: hypothetical protein VFA46_10395 [Actinomycetes bacterium]|nr:hypothetical protein [Actinomycetes bacterium]
MAFKDDLADPWGLLLGATAGGTAWAVGLPVLAGAGVGAAVWLTKAVVARLERGRHGAARLGWRRLPVERRAPEGRWLERAQRAVEGFSQLGQGMSAGPLAERVAMMAPKVRDTVAALERLAGQATAVGQAIARLDGRFLASEAERLRAGRARASGDVAAELDRSLASVQAQREVLGRLAAARTSVLARLESGTLGLESLVARLVELEAMAAGGPAGDLGTVQQLSDELEGIRQGLAETEEVSRRALSAYQRASG